MPLPAAVRLRLMSSFSNRRVSLPHTTLHVEIGQTIENPTYPIVCLPGALGTATTDFSFQLTQLPQLNPQFQVISFDPRGYGQSQPPRRDFPLDFLERDAEDAMDLMCHLGHEKFSVIGWSDGANSAAILAAKYPESVDRLVLIAGNAFITETDMQMMEAIRDTSQWSKKMRQSLAKVYGDELQPMWTEWFETYRALYDKGGDLYCTYLPKIKSKSLVVCGRKDPLVPELHAEYLYERISHSKLHWYEDGKHNVHIKYADDFNQLVTEFFTENDDKMANSREFTAVPKI